ncbi:MAG: hypothetical protein K5866_04105 [Treponema sp.]|nr:hypothetical protein [Treponema sp.]
MTNKKGLLSILLLSFIFTGLHAQTLDASKLTDNLARSVSLSNLFFGRFSGYVNELYYNVDEYDEFVPSYLDTYLDALWYTGFDINTDYGSQTGSLIKGYADLFTGYKFNNLIFAFGTGGTRHGVFLSDINFNLPSDDPMRSNALLKTVKVTDFMGNQLLNDIYSVVGGWNGYFWLGGYFLTCKTFDSLSSGVMSNTAKTSLGYWGLKSQILSTLYTDLLFDTDFALESFDWTVDVITLAALIAGNAIGLDLNVATGVNWDSVSAVSQNKTEDKIDWKSFYIPLDYSQTFGDKYFNWSINAGTRLAVGEFYHLAGSVLSSAVLGASVTYRKDHVSKKGVASYNEFAASLSTSFYSNKNLAYYGNSSSTKAFGVDFRLSYEYTDMITLEAVYKRNYFSDLADLNECKDKHIVGFNVRFTIPTEDYKIGPRPEVEEENSTEIEEVESSDSSSELNSSSQEVQVETSGSEESISDPDAVYLDNTL